MLIAITIALAAHAASVVAGDIIIGCRRQRPITAASDDDMPLRTDTQTDRQTDRQTHPHTHPTKT